MIAIFVAYIAYQEHRTRSDQFKLNLYDRRYTIYKAITALLRDAMINATVNPKVLNQFIADTNEREFLFDKEIPNYIDTLRGKAIRLAMVSRLLNDARLPIGDKRTGLAQESYDLLTWFQKQFDESRELFKKYLIFKE
ncbi:MAG TPA: hypothetical protein VMX18_03360 [Candidatus Bipolaricaulota bacterium]|nr:hypothetical protein [Candidatus Bipolaricaulota bacterium]